VKIAECETTAALESPLCPFQFSFSTFDPLSDRFRYRADGTPFASNAISDSRLALCKCIGRRGLVFPDDGRTMMRRPVWSGFLRLNLVTVPVAAFTAAQPEGGQVRFHQLHELCHSRIKYQKVCPIHGEVTAGEIITGYEYAKGKYVIVERAEKEEARSRSERSIELETFVEPSSVDPLWYSGSDYYLIPDGAEGKKPYSLLYRAMEDEERYAVGKAVLWGRDHVVLVRPHDKTLTLSLLKFANQVRLPSEFKDDIPHPHLSADELKLARMLVQATSGEADLTKYRDTYNDRLKELIEAKVEGREVVAPPEEEEPGVINLMDALKKSVANVKRPGKSTTGKRGAEGHSAKARRKSS
jgi:DNA end-binding protein Ku